MVSGLPVDDKEDSHPGEAFNVVGGLILFRPKGLGAAEGPACSHAWEADMIGGD